jgi:RHS repeat-associated protein
MTCRWRIRKASLRGIASACSVFLLLLAGSPVRAGDVIEYYHLDALGNVRAVTNAAGQVTERHDYLPFGEECTNGPCASNPALGGGQPRKFTSKERDPETGLDYFGARYYGSKIGRFTTVDPYLDTRAALFNPQRWNRYAYGLNNPLRYVDPDGRDTWDAMSGWFNAVSSNVFLGGGRMEAYNQDYATGQAAGDRFSLALGVIETGIGFGGGAVLEIPSVGTVTIPAAAIVTHGLGVSATAGIYLAKNVGEPGGPKVGTEGGPGAGKRFSDKTKDAARAENPNCVFCDRPTTREPGPTQSNIDHAKAKSRAGNNTAANAQNTCRECNQKKGAKSTEEFLKQ